MELLGLKLDGDTARQFTLPPPPRDRDMRDIGRKVVLNDIKPAFTFTPALNCIFL